MEDGNSDKLIQNTTNALHITGLKTIPKMVKNSVKRHSIAGWKEEIKPITDELNHLRNLSNLGHNMSQKIREAKQNITKQFANSKGISNRQLLTRLQKVT